MAGASVDLMETINNNKKKRRRVSTSTEKCRRNMAVTGCLLVLSMFTQQCNANGNGIFHYEAPSDCQWTLINSSSSSSYSSLMMSSGGGDSAATSSSSLSSSAVTLASPEVSLHCRLRTINSQFDQTNFSVVPREHTTSLTIECSDSLLYQRFIQFNSLLNSCF